MLSSHRLKPFGFSVCSLVVTALFAVFPPWDTPSFAAGVSVDNLKYGVFPYLPINSIEEIHAPIAKRFSEIIGHPIKVESRPTFDLFRSAVEHQRYDIIFIQPFAYVRAAAPNGYIPIARYVSPDDKEFKGTIRAEFVALSSVPTDRITQLENGVIAMPPADAAVSLLGIEYLKQYGLYDGVNIQIRYHENHFSCLQQLIIHKARACVSALPAIRLFEADKKVSLNIFANSQEIPSSLIAVQKRVPVSQRLRLQQDIIGWSNTSEGKKLLRRAHLLGFIPTTDKDYDIVRHIWLDVQGSE